MGLTIRIGAALVSTLPVPAGTDDLRTDRLNVYGWHCRGAGCSSLPRVLGDAIRFDAKRSRLTLGPTERLATNWQVTLNCASSRNGFSDCRFEDDSTPIRAARRAVIRLVESIRAERMATARGHGSARVVLIIRYSAQDCPEWRCVTGPPPAAIAPPAFLDRRMTRIER